MASGLMARPFVLIGGAMASSMLLYPFFSLNTIKYLPAVSFAAGLIAAALSFMCSFSRGRRALTAAGVILLSIAASGSLFVGKTRGEYLPAIKFADGKKHFIQCKVIKKENKRYSNFCTVRAESVDGESVDFIIRLSSDREVKAQTDDTLFLNDAVIYERGKSAKSKRGALSSGEFLGAYGFNYKTEKARCHTLRYYASLFKDRAQTRLYLILPEKSAALMSAMLFGSLDGMDEETAADFRYSGVSHLFAVSGLHLSVWTGLLFFFLGTFRRVDKLFRFAVCSLFILSYMFVTGFGWSVVRAGIMLLIFEAAPLFSKKSDGINSLFISITLMMFFEPFCVNAVSMQLSFLTTLGLLCFSDVIGEKAKAIKDGVGANALRRVLSYAASGIMVSLVAVLFSLPVVCLSFGFFSGVAPLSNLLMVLPAQAAMVSSGLALIFYPVTFMFKPLSLFASVISKYLMFVAKKLSHLEYAGIKTDTAAQTAAALFIFLFAVFCAVRFSGDRKRLYRALLTSTALCVVFSVSAVIYQKNTFLLSASDVGDGVCVRLSVGGDDVLFGAFGTRGEYAAIGDIDESLGRKLELLIYPKSKGDKASFADLAASRFSPNLVFVGNENSSSGSAEKATVFRLDGGAVIRYIDNKGHGAALISYRNTRCAILFDPVLPTDGIKGDVESYDITVVRKKRPEGLKPKGIMFLSTDIKHASCDANEFSTSMGRLVFRADPFGFKSTKVQK